MDRLAHLIGIGRATLVDDTGEVQLVQVTEGATGAGMDDQVTDKVKRVAEFGLASVPPIGSEVLLLRRLGQRALAMVIGTSHRPSRPRGLKPGDTAIYDVRGAKVQLTADGLLIDCAGLPAIIQNAITITLKATQKVTIDAPAVEVLHDVKVGGTFHATGTISTDADVTFAGHSVTTLRTSYGAHKHGGVKAGSDASAGPDTVA
ncbi:phage baseplate assembly protein V [Sphingomonas bacterium]|uniref:phage baseplate assembly protein V n=1 Tax=Sphingomonas bacterium TaxID=1895847 RepID=UPI0015764EA6|nr:phage baseplate assembly protein V [Sphingomonas bacterium]